MRVLEVEPRRLEETVQRLNLPAQLVGVHGLLRPVVANQYLQLGDSVRVLELGSSQIDVLAFEQIEFVQELLLPQLQVVEEPECPDFLATARLLQSKVLPDAQVVADAHAVEVAGKDVYSRSNKVFGLGIDYRF